MTLAEYIICMGLSHAKEQVSLATHQTQHTHTCMCVCVCVCGTMCVCVAHFVINVGFRGGWQWRCVSLPACLQPGAERHHPDRRIFPGAECYHTFTLVVVSNIYTKYTWVFGTLQRMCERVYDQVI